MSLAGGQVGGAEVHRAPPHGARGQPPAGGEPAVEHHDLAAGFAEGVGARQARDAGTHDGQGSALEFHGPILGAAGRRRPPGTIARVPVTITDPADPRVADFRDLKAGDRPAGDPAVAPGR